MTDEMKANDATRYFIITFGDKYELHPTPFDNEGAARKMAEELAVAEPGVRFGLFEKTGTVFAELEPKWKGRAS